MIRTMVIIAVAGFFMALACFSAAAAIGGPDVWRNGWSWPGWVDGDFDLDVDVEPGSADGGEGPTTTRELTWTGSHELEIAVPAEVRFTQGPETKLVVIGPEGTVENIEVDDERIKFDRRVRRPGRVQIIMSAPSIDHFTLLGAGKLFIEGYDHENLRLTIAGAADATVRGKARDAEVEIAGTGDIDLGGLEADNVSVEIAGAGDATIAPKLSADIEIAGAGDVRLLTRPANVSRRIAGAGRVTYADGTESSVAGVSSSSGAAPASPPAASPPAAPAVPAPPAPKGGRT